MDTLDLHLDPAVGSSDLLGIGLKRADFEYGYMPRPRVPAKSSVGAPAPPPPTRPATGRQHQQQQQQQANSRIYVNPEVYSMIRKAAKELDQFQTALDNELDAHIPASERQRTLQSLGLGNVHKKGGAFSQLQQVDTHPGQPRPPELEIPPDPESPQASAGAVNVGFNRPLGDLLSRLDEEEQQRQHKDKEQEREEDQGVAGGSQSEDNKGSKEGSSSSGIEEDQDDEGEEGEQESSSAFGSEHVQSPPRALQRSFTSQESNKSNRSATHSAGGQRSGYADQDLNPSDGSDGIESDDGGLEGEKSEGASMRSKQSSRSSSFFSKHTESGEDEEEGSSSEASEDEDVPEFSMGKSSTFTSQVVDRRKISHDQESEQDAETEEHRAARLKAEQDIQDELRMVHNRTTTFRIPGEGEAEGVEEGQKVAQAPPAEIVKQQKRRHKKYEEKKEQDDTAEAEMAARRRALFFDGDDEDEEPDGSGNVNNANANGTGEGSKRKDRVSQAGDASKLRRSFAHSSQSGSPRRSMAGTGGRTMQASATFKDNASPRISCKGSTGGMDMLVSVEEEMEERGSPGRKRSMFGDLRRSNAGQGAWGGAGGVSMKDRKQLADPADAGGRRLSTAGMELLGNVNQDLKALITAQANAQREMRTSSAGYQDKAGDSKKSQRRKPWTNITYIPPSLRGASDLIDTTPCAERVDPFSREDYAPPLSEPTLRLPSKPRPPPSRGRTHRLEEQRRREGEEQPCAQESQALGKRCFHACVLPAEASDIYTEIEDVLLMGEDNNKSIPMQIVTHKQISDHAIVGRAMRVQWGKLAKELDDNDPSASKLQDIPLPLDGLPSPSPPKSPLQVVGTNATKKKKGIEDAANKAFQTWQQPQGQTSAPLPETLKLDKPTSAASQAWVQQGVRHNTVVPRTPCNLAVLPSKHATPANTPQPFPLQEGFSPQPASPLYSHPDSHLEGLKPGAQDRPSPSQSLVKPRTLQLSPDLEPTPSNSSPKAPKPLRSHPKSRPDKSQSPDRSSDPHKELKPSPQWASMDTRPGSLDQPKHPPKVPPQHTSLDTRVPCDTVYLTQTPDISEALTGTALAESHEALQAIAADGYNAWREHPPIEETTASGQQQQGVGRQWQGGKEHDRPPHKQQQGLGQPSQQHHRRTQHSFENSARQSLARMSSFLQPTVERPSKWRQPVPQQVETACGAPQQVETACGAPQQVERPSKWRQPMPPKSLPSAPHSNVPSPIPVMPAFAPSKTAKPHAPAISAHFSHSPNLHMGEGQPGVGPIGPATKVSSDTPSNQNHAMPYFLRKLIALRHPQKKAEHKQSHLSEDPFLPRLKDASPVEPERSSLSDSSPWLQRSFKDTYCAGQGLSHIPNLPEISTSHSADLAAPADARGPASKHGRAGRSLAPHHDQQQCYLYGLRKRIPLAARAKGEVFYPELRPTRVTPGPAIYLGGFERKSSPVILLGHPDSPGCTLGAPRADDHSVSASQLDDHSTPAKHATKSARNSPPKTRLHQPLVLGKPRHLLFQHQQQALEEQASKMFISGGGPHLGHVPAEAAASEPQKHPVSDSLKPPTLTGGRVDTEQAASKDSTWQPPELNTSLGSIEPLASCSSPQRPAKRKGPLPPKGGSASSVFSPNVNGNKYIPGPGTQH